MKRTHRTAFSSFLGSIVDGFNNLSNLLNGIIEPQAQTHPQQNAEAAQLQDSLEIESRTDTHTLALSQQAIHGSLAHHGVFNIPLEMFEGIFQHIATLKYRWLREVSKPFLFAWENAAAPHFIRLTPTLCELPKPQGYSLLLQKQQKEIKYLIDERENILINHSFKNYNILAKLINSLDSLALIADNNDSYMSYYAREKCLNSFNMAIIRKEIARAQQNGSYTLDLSQSNLTRFPDELFSDESLKTFWEKVASIKITYNHLSSSSQFEWRIDHKGNKE